MFDGIRSDTMRPARSLRRGPPSPQRPMRSR